MCIRDSCTDENGGWALGCRIDGGQAEYVRVPFADQGLNKIPEGVTDRDVYKRQHLTFGNILGCRNGLILTIRIRKGRQKP